MAAPDIPKLVAELRQRLDADPTVERDLIQGGEVLDDACLRRWLRADKYSLDAAEERLRAHAKWRVATAPNGRIEEREVQNELDADKAYLQGRDLQGRPCVVVTAKNHIVSERNLQECKRSICYVLDRACEQVDTALNPDGQLCIIFDLRGLGLANLDVSILRSVFDTLANHYPERMGVLYMYDAPYLFWGLWKCVSPFIEAETMKKVKFVYASDPAELLSNFDPEELPEDFGGKAKMVRVDHSAAAFAAQNGNMSAQPAEIAA